VYSQFVFQVEALASEARCAHPDVHLLPKAHGRAKVDLDSRQDHCHLGRADAVERTQSPEELDSRVLQPREKDRVVHVPHRIEVAKPRRLAVHERVTVHADDAIDGLVAGEATREAVFAQPDWLRVVPTDRRLPDGARVVYTGCGTSFHAALTAGTAVQALDAVMQPPQADVLVLVSHEGATLLTLEAARAFAGPKWLVSGRAEGPIAELCEEVIVATPAVERSWCHTASYTCTVAALAALRGEDISWLPDAVARALEAKARVSEHKRWLVAGSGSEQATVLEAVLKLREGAFVAAEAHHTEQLLHGQLSAIDESVRCFVLEGERRAAERGAEAASALEALGCDVTLVPTRHPVVDIVRFHLLVLDLAAARGVNPDMIRRDDERWARARAAYR
jgi:glutamine---fructose-6-phosphate transaminase (isomerizing)